MNKYNLSVKLTAVASWQGEMRNTIVSTDMDASITAESTMGAVVSAGAILSGTLSKGESNGASTEEYTGPYVVTPKMSQQVLNTTDKYMTDDVTVKGVPLYETSNNSGGTTLYIACEEIDYREV